MRTLDELINRTEPGIDQVHEWLAQATNQVEVLASDVVAGERALVALQVTTRSPMGALAYGTGGLLVDRGWVRVLGAGCPRLPRSLASWNAMQAGQPQRLRDGLLVGDDAIGGFFALNSGSSPGTAGNIRYHAPDTLEWEDLEMGYSDWLFWLFTGDVAGFYEGSRWTGWEQEVATLRGDQAISVVPFLFTDGPPLDQRSRRPVPVEELWGLYVEDLPKQLAQQPDRPA